MIQGVDELIDRNAAKSQKPQRLGPKMALDEPKFAILAKAFKRHADFIVGQERVGSPPDRDEPRRDTLAKAQASDVLFLFSQSILPQKPSTGRLS